MVEEIPDSDKGFLALLPMLANWIESDRRLTDEQMTAFLRQYPNHFDMAADCPLDDRIAMISKYENHPFYGRGIKIVQSPEGRKWLDGFFLQVKEAARNIR